MRDGLRPDSPLEGEPAFRAAASFPFDIVPQGTHRMPGGFVQLPNRIFDLGIWATMPDVARAAYPVFCRFADSQKDYTVELSIRKLMECSGLSESSAKRARGWLLGEGLLRILAKGGRSKDGSGEANIYQLQFPVPTQRGVGVSAEPHRESAVNPSGGHSRTPVESSREPYGGSVNPTLWGSGQTPNTDIEFKHKNTTTKGEGSVAHPPVTKSPSVADVVVLLRKEGTDEDVAIELASLFSRERIEETIDTMRWRKSKGKCDNPAGFIHDMLKKQWAVPKAVSEAKRKRLIAEGHEATIREERLRRQAEMESLTAEEKRVERIVAEMDVETRASYCRRAVASFEQQQNTPMLHMIQKNKADPTKLRLVRVEMARLWTDDKR